VKLLLALALVALPANAFDVREMQAGCKDGWCLISQEMLAEILSKGRPLCTHET
jgi:hypothetical protein